MAAGCPAKGPPPRLSYDMDKDQFGLVLARTDLGWGWQ